MLEKMKKYRQEFRAKFQSCPDCYYYKPSELDEVLEMADSSFKYGPTHVRLKLEEAKLSGEQAIKEFLEGVTVYGMKLKMGTENA